MDADNREGIIRLPRGRVKDGVRQPEWTGSKNRIDALLRKPVAESDADHFLVRFVRPFGAALSSYDLAADPALKPPDMPVMQLRQTRQGHSLATIQRADMP